MRGLRTALLNLVRLDAVRVRLESMLFTLLLRALTLASKLLLLVALARWLSPAEVAEYGLIVATASVGMTVAGLELYSITAREIVKSSKVRQARTLRDQFAVYPIAYLILGIVGVAAAQAGVLPASVAAKIWLLVVVESISHECFRILVVLGRPIGANLVLFVRTGAWAYLVIGVFWYAHSWRTLGIVISAWLIGAGLSIVLAMWIVRDLPWRATRGVAVDWPWLRASIIKGWPFMLSAVLALILTYGDRFILTGFVDRNSLGVFTLYSTLAIAISSLATTAVSQHFLPRVIRAHQTSLLEFRSSLRRFAAVNLLFVVALVLIALPAIHLVVLAVGNPIYSSELQTYYALMGAAGLRSLSDVPSYALYAGHKDRTLLVTNVVAAIISLCASLMLIPTYGTIGAGIAALVSATSLYVLQTIMAALLMKTLRRAATTT